MTNDLLKQSGLTVWGGVIWLSNAIALAALIVRHRYQFLLIINILGLVVGRRTTNH
ncbi:hypothetical protein [Scytonema sp. NUACC21]